MIQLRAVVRRCVVAVVVAGLVAAGAPAVMAGEPTEHLRTRMELALRALVDPALKGAGKVRERRVAVFKIAQDIFDFHETARLSLGKHWEQLSAADRAEFAELFMSLIERSYISNVEMYDGEKVLYTGESIEGDHAVVRSKIVTKQGEETAIDYRMLLRPGDHWRVYDVKIEGISLVSNYRAQFNKVIHASSFQELVRRLKEKQVAPVPAAEPVSASPSTSN
jgi:phospholipid transport system substrate-binding protein